MVGSINTVGNVARTAAIDTDDQQRVRQQAASKSSTRSTSVDTLEISEEALKLQADAQQGSSAIVKGSASETARIKNNIASGFYNNPAVQRAVASKINQEIPSSKV